MKKLNIVGLKIKWTISNILEEIWKLLSKEIAHSKRVFCLDEKEKRIINLKDMNNGYDLFIDNDEVKKRGSSKPINYMYC